MTALDIVKIITLVITSGFLVALIAFLFKLISLIGSVQDIVDNNKTDIDITIREIPLILRNITGITDKTDRLVTDLTPDIKGIAGNVQGTLQSVENISEDAEGLVDYFTVNIVDATESVKNRIFKRSGFTGYFLDAFDIVRSFFG